MKSYRARLLVAFVSICFAGSAHAASYSKELQQACRNDYKKFCSEYGIDSPALRTCMDRAGKGLSKVCVEALIDAGEISRAEVERRKKLGR